MPILSRSTGPEPIAWSIARIPVNVDWDSASMTAPGGYDRMQGRVTGTLQTRKLKQGAVIVGTRPNGKVLWKGLLASQPKISNDVAVIEAEGFSGIIRRRNNRLPYMISDASQWSASNEQPFDYTNHQKYTQQSKNDGVGWLIDSGTTYNNGDRSGYALYTPGHAVQRIKATMRKAADDANFELQVRQGTDLGAVNVVGAAFALGAGNPDGTAWNVGAVNANTVVVNLNNTSGGVAGTKNRVMLQSLVACVIADDDDWITSDVVSDVAQRVGFADNVNQASTEIGGLDWTGSWDELLTYLAGIEDWTWLVEEDRTKGQPADAMLTFRDWGNKVWQTNLDMSQENLTVAPLYNRVAVMFERPEGVPNHKSYEVDDFNDLKDPIADGRVYAYPDPPVLENPQRGTGRADAIGEKLLRRVCVIRLVGSIQVGALLKGHPFDMKAGDKLKVNGFNPDAPPQRISQITYKSNGTADVNLERSFDIAGMLNRLAHHRRRTTPHGHGSGHRS